MKHIYGPVPSRRLGNSLGIDIVPFKQCGFDCIYCQLGRTTEVTIRRKHYSPVPDILNELKGALNRQASIDIITFSGSGEPTLNRDLGRLISTIKEITAIPVAVITNASLLWREDVQNDLLKADIVVPSLDAGSEAVFQKINRPPADLRLESIIDGLIEFRKKYKGQIWLEVFLIEGVNTDDEEVARIADAASNIQPDRIQLNTAVRPPAEPSVVPLPKEHLEQFIELFPGPVEIIADYERRTGNEIDAEVSTRILELLKRRPCTMAEMSSSLKVHRIEMMKHLNALRIKGIISHLTHNGQTYFKVK
jgi:wyosine [tRNA(Phe)-imidazoG37] synthetase (radical SAM superfamily)